MHHLIYLSYATTPFDDAALQALLTQSRHLNAQQNITGMLLHGNGQFFQVLEGEENTVRATYARISHDARHRDVTVFADKSIPARVFADWSMAYHALDPQLLLETTGYIKPESLRLERPGLSLADTQLLQLMRTFVLPEGP